MKQLITAQKRAMLLNTRKQILSITLLGLYATWMQWKSFGFVDFSEMVWLGAVLILSIIIWRLYNQKILAPEMWVAFGTLCWSFWRYLGWIFASRSGLTIGLISILTTPLQNLLEVDVVELIIFILTLIFVLVSMWGAHWTYKNFDINWLRNGSIYWLLLFSFVVVVAIYSAQQQFQDNCFGLNAYTSSLFCQVSNNLGVVGSIWVTITFVLWALTFTLHQAKIYGVLANLWIIALEPVWIEIFFNPSRILSVILFKEIRTPGDNIPAGMLEANIQALNLLPLAAFFVLIPIGLLILRSEKLRLWWMLSASTITFVSMLGVLFRALEIGKPVFTYPTAEKGVFVFMALQLLLPLVIMALVGDKPSISSSPETSRPKPV
jgi:hypothetical protein